MSKALCVRACVMLSALCSIIPIPSASDQAARDTSADDRLRAIYTALAGFASATLLALLGVVLERRLPVPMLGALEMLAALAGALGVGGIVWAAALLLGETRIAVSTLQVRARSQEARFRARASDVT